MGLRIFRIVFGISFLLFGIIISLFQIRWGYGFVASAIIAEIFSIIGDTKTKIAYSKKEVSEKKHRIHHLHFGLVMVIVGCFLVNWTYFDIYMGFSVSMFLHDFFYHLPVELFDLDKEWRKKYSKPSEDSDLKLDMRPYFT